MSDVSKKIDLDALRAELAKVLDREEKTLAPLVAIKYPRERIPRFSNGTTFWHEIVAELDGGIVKNGVPRLVAEVARLYPGNEVFCGAKAKRKRSPHSSPVDAAAPVAPTTPSTTRSLRITLPSSLGTQKLLELLEGIAAMPAAEHVVVDIVTVGSYIVQISADLTTEQQEQLRTAIEHYLQQQQQVPEARVESMSHGFRDYLMDPLYVQGPDGSGFEVTGVQASTRVKDFGRMVVDEAYQSSWPSQPGQTPHASVDLLPGGDHGQRRRLHNDQTLHDAGVRPHDTVVVNPEATAGSVNPMVRAEATVNARNQIYEYARANPGFEVQANSLEIPNQYVFRFDAPGFASVDPLVPIDHHEVFLALPPDFPLRPPAAFWQHDFFHPNVHYETGGVCLGILADGYRPGLHFGTVCQMLVDMAGYRSYVVTEGYNPEAAAWLASPVGQLAIIARGGRPLFELDAEPVRSRNVRVRRVER